jgi:hypothetical protein
MRLLLSSSLVVSLVTWVCAVLAMRLVSRKVLFHVGRYLLPMNVVSGWSLLLLGAVFVLIAFTVFVVRVRALG